MVETRFDELKRYVRFGADDARALLAFRAVAEPHFVRIAREFYERIREHEEAHAVFTGEEQIERLQRSMVRWMGRVLSGTYDEAYFEETRKIGRVHVRVGLPQRYMFTAMALMRVSLEDVAEKEAGAAAKVVRTALTRILDLELAMMLESYREDLAEQARRRDEFEAQSLRSDLARTLLLHEAALDASPSLIVGIDPRGMIRLFNRAAQTITGYALEDVFGAPFVELLVADAARPKDAALVASLLAGTLTQLADESLLKTRSGKVRDVRWSFTRTDDGGPEDIVLFANGEDVTDTRAASRQAHQHEKLAALGTLAAGLAHEIRNPLNGAQLHVAFLRRALEKKLPEPELLEAAGVVGDEIKRLARLVSEFLDFARPSALTNKRVVVQALVTRTLELTGPLAAQAGIVIVADVPPQELVIVADGGKLEQVLLNVVQNAIDALSPGGSGRIVVRVRRHPRDVVVEIEDDGPGLPSPNAPVFDAFFSTKPTGTGLGLAITHRIVTDHGGTVGVESRPGRTCFRFTLPIGNESAALEGESA
ncbi:MAG: two-component sensor histidine kinase [Labilithrix sp.]|nr:two-component sensor histidine kinase [Labilithrix sp.]